MSWNGGIRLETSKPLKHFQRDPQKLFGSGAKKDTLFRPIHMPLSPVSVALFAQTLRWKWASTILKLGIRF
jgi:hypothetical protein